MGALEDFKPRVVVSDNTKSIAVLTTPSGGGVIPGSGSTDSLLVANRLAELDTPEAKAAARANLDLQYIDGGTFN